MDARESYFMHKKDQKKIMVGHWVGNVFVMCWSYKSRLHELSDKCEEYIKKSDEVNQKFQEQLKLV